jgi:hypothetical protein
MTTLFLMAFAGFGLLTLGFALYRVMLERVKPDECLHLLDADADLVERQRTSSIRLQTVDKWGIPLTIATALCGLGAYGSWWLGM